MSGSVEKAILAGGCFWGMQDLIRKRPGVLETRVGLHGRRRPERHLPQPRHARGGDRDRLRPRADVVPRPARVLLPDPRPDDAEPSGERHRDELPLGDLLPRRGAAPRRGGHDRRRRGLRPLAGKVVTEVEPAGPFWEAEPEHQDYLEKYPNGYTCHFPRPGWVLPRRAPAPLANGALRAGRLVAHKFF